MFSKFSKNYVSYSSFLQWVAVQITKEASRQIKNPHATLSLCESGKLMKNVARKYYYQIYNLGQKICGRFSCFSTICYHRKGN